MSHLQRRGLQMGEPTNNPRERFLRILGPMRLQQSFTAEAIKSVCEGVAPSTVTTVIRQLKSEGWLVEDRSSDGDSPADIAGEVRLRWNESASPFSVDAWIDRQIRGTQITQTPVEERPRERLMKLGASHLRTAELLAILIRTGRKGESALQAGERITNRFADSLDQLPSMGLAELKQISTAVSEPAYCQIMAGIELGRRVATAIDRSLVKETRITSADTAIEYCKRRFARLAMDGRQEEFHIVTLDTKYQPISTHRVTVGTLDASLVHPREVFRPAIRDAASAVILVHNHPSGDPTPSNEDRQVTRQLEKAADIIGISILDHIIVAGDIALSLKQWESSCGS